MRSIAISRQNIARNTGIFVIFSFCLPLCCYAEPPTQAVIVSSTEHKRSLDADKLEKEEYYSIKMTQMVRELAKNLGFHEIALGQIGSANYQKLKLIKACVSRTDTDVENMYGSSNHGRASYVVLVKGQNSGPEMIIGSDCSNTVRFGQIDVTVISKISERAQKYGSVVEYNSLFPINIGFRDSKGGNTRISYKTVAGSLTIYDSSPDVISAILLRKSGETIFQAEYQTVTVK